MVTPVLAAAAVSLSIVILWWSIYGERSRAATSRSLLMDLPRTEGAAPSLGSVNKAGGPLGASRKYVRDVLPDRFVSSVERKALLAGLAGGSAIDRLLVIKMVGPVAGLLLALMLPSTGLSKLLSLVSLPFLGYRGPELALTMRARHRQNQIYLALADTLDQITVSVEAGLGFEAALARTGRSTKGPLADELLRTLQDVHAGMSRAEAMGRLADRTDVPDLRHFVLAIRQAEDYGVPIAQVLRVQARELRIKRRQNAEERAMKLPMKMVFPLLFCIMPALFIVLLGPGAIRFAQNGLTGG